MKRFFYAGCSFTRFPYPTWGDIIAYDKLNYKGYDYAHNLGAGGGCNQLIASRLAWADKKYNFTDQDDIAIMWTSLFRESVLTTWFDEPHTRWHAYGNSFNNPVWSEVTKHPYLHNTYNMLDRNATTFHYVNKLYKPFYQGRIDVDGMDHYETYDSLKEKEIVKPMLFNYPGQHEEYLEKFWYEYKNLDAFDFSYQGPFSEISDIFSNHPDISQHLNHAKKVTNLDPLTVSYFEFFADKLLERVRELKKSKGREHTKHEIHTFELLTDFKNNSGIKGISSPVPDYT